MSVTPLCTLNRTKVSMDEIHTSALRSFLPILETKHVLSRLQCTGSEVNADSETCICRQLRMTPYSQEYAEEGGQTTAHSVQQSLLLATNNPVDGSAFCMLE